MSKEKKEYPKQLILERKGNRLFHFTKPNCKPVKVFPGVNVYNDSEEISQIMDHHAYKGLIESDAHKVHSELPGGKKKKNTKVFSAMPVNQAKDLISKTYSKAALEALRNEEMSGQDRKSVVNAIEDQIKMVENPSEQDLKK